MIKLYDDIKQLNIKRFNEFTKYIIQANNINGQSSKVLTNLNASFAQVDKDLTKARKLIENALISLEMLKNSVNIYSLAFVLLSENGPNNLDLDYLNNKLFDFYIQGINASEMEKEVKKSEAFINTQFKRYSFSERSSITITTKVVRRALALYDYHFKPSKRELAVKDLTEVNNYFLDRQKIPIFNPNSKSEETNIIDSSYERNNISLTRLLGSNDYDNLTVYRYYSLINEAQEIAKKMK